MRRPWGLSKIVLTAAPNDNLNIWLIFLKGYIRQLNLSFVASIFSFLTMVPFVLLRLYSKVYMAVSTRVIRN